jgi:ABC-type oligopeptide transport system substrate-binding subunit
MVPLPQAPARLWLVLLAGLAVAGCSSQAEESYFGRLDPPPESILRVGNGQEPRSFDPHKSIAYPEGHVYLNIYEGLASRDGKTLEPRPAIATAWWTTADRRRWIFALRRGVRFSDGVPITAHDFVYSWRRLVDPQRASPYVFAAYGIKNARAIAEGKLPVDALGVQALDDFTLAVDLEQPTPYFDKLVTAWAFVALPRHVIEHRGDRWTQPEHLVASGPFRLAEHVPYHQIVLEKNPLYWDRHNVQLERVYLYPVADGAQNVNLYRAGEIDVMRGGYLPLPMIPRLSLKRDFQRGPYFASRYFSYNLARKPFDDVRVRRALSLAIDRAVLAAKFIGNGEVPAGGVVPPIVPGYWAPEAVGFDPEGARRLLAEAGYPGGRGFPAFSLTLFARDDVRKVGEAIQSMWKHTLGIDVRLESEEGQTYTARLERRDFAVTTDGWVGDYIDPTAFLDIFVEANANNHSGWTDPRYATLLRQASVEPDARRRLALLAAAEARLVEASPVIPLTYMALNYLKKPWVQGWYVDPLEQHQFKYVRIERQWQSASRNERPVESGD